MKSENRFIKTIIILILLFLIILNTSISSFGQELTAEEIISKMNKLMNQDSVEAKVKMSIVTTSGEERIFIYDSYSKNSGEKNLLRYIEPKRAQGQAILMLNYADDIWMYFPRTKRIRKLATNSKSQKMEGSDFSYPMKTPGQVMLLLKILTVKNLAPKLKRDMIVTRLKC
jgi:hypothetical protein